jgi:hypothetical protein
VADHSATTDVWRAVSGTTWRDRAPEMLRDTITGPRGEPCLTSTDRRWLWRLEAFLSVNETNGRHHDVGRDLLEYLRETCEHHWDDPGGWVLDDDGPTLRQCIWCNLVEAVTSDA